VRLRFILQGDFLAAVYCSPGDGDLERAAVGSLVAQSLNERVC